MVVISDRGVGVSESVEPNGDRTAGFGLFAMGARLGLLGGGAMIDSLLRGATQITLIAPIMDPETA